MDNVRIGALVLAAFTSACVSTDAYRKKDAELTALRTTSAETQQAAATRERRLQQELARTRAQLASLARKYAAASEELEIQRDVSANDRALLAQLQKRLETLGQNVDSLTREKGAFAAGMAEAYSRLRDLRLRKDAADERALLYADLVQKLGDMISAGTLEVIVRGGRMLIVMPNDVLFDSGRTEIKATGRSALTAVSAALKVVEDRRFTVIGHTDDVPIHTARFRSNWDLSTARAVEVALFLIEKGLKPETLAASGRGQFDPVESNATDQGRTRNRRVEIALEPKITELPRMPDLGVANAL
jgi:chemotaxis protein MotB